MLKVEDCQSIGHIGKPHGYDGSVKIELHRDISYSHKRTEPVFLLINRKPVPFFTTSYNEDSQPPIVRFEDINTLEAAKKLTGIEILASQKRVDGETPVSIADLIGYLVISLPSFPLGRIVSTMDAGLQELLVMEYRNKEILIPFQPGLIADIDHEEKKIFFSLPEGLLELYLEEE